MGPARTALDLGLQARAAMALSVATYQSTDDQCLYRDLLTRELDSPSGRVHMPPRVQLCVAGFPCSDCSGLGRRKGVAGPQAQEPASIELASDPPPDTASVVRSEVLSQVSIGVALGGSASGPGVIALGAPGEASAWPAAASDGRSQMTLAISIGVETLACGWLTKKRPQLEPLVVQIADTFPTPPKRERRRGETGLAGHCRRQLCQMHRWSEELMRIQTGMAKLNVVVVACKHGKHRSVAMVEDPKCDFKVHVNLDRRANKCKLINLCYRA